MARNIVAVSAGFILWWAIGIAGLLALHSLWPAYALLEREPQLFTLGMQLSRLLVGVACSVGGGWLAGRLAQGRLGAPWALGLVLLVIFIPIHVRQFASFPLWYHLAFLLTLAPLVAAGGYCGRARRRSG